MKILIGNERQEFAKQLRDSLHTDEYLDQVIANALLKTVGETCRPIGLELANMIDPTCERVSMDAAGNPPFYTGGLALNNVVSGCSVCGYPFSTKNANIGNPFGVPNYCPNCGRRVMNNNEAY